MHSPTRLGLSSRTEFASPFPGGFGPAKPSLQSCSQGSGFIIDNAKLWIPSKWVGLVNLPSHQGPTSRKCKKGGCGVHSQLRLWQVKKSVLLRVSAGEPNNQLDGRQEHNEHLKEGRGRKENSVYPGRKRGYIWVLGPFLITVPIVYQIYFISFVDLLRQSYPTCLCLTFGLDLLFVFFADAFFGLANNTGQHQQVAGGPAPWIGPWEYTGYPDGFPRFWHYLSYAGVVIGLVSLLLSTFLGKLPIALVVFGPYLALILAQAAYERILSNDRLPTYPLVPIIYTLYRFWQLARGLETVSSLGGGNLLASALRLLIAVWIFYLAMHITHLPWLYSTWNANRIV